MIAKLAIAPALLIMGCAHAEAPKAEAPGVETTSDKMTMGHHSDGLVRMVSAYGVAETAARLEAALDARGVSVMAKIDHSANAAGVDLALPPTVLVLFGNPAAGTRLMQARRAAAIDLPMKALIYEENGQTMLAFNAIDYIVDRHGIDGDLAVIEKIEALLGAVAAEATGAQ